MLRIFCVPICSCFLSSPQSSPPRRACGIFMVSTGEFYLTCINTLVDIFLSDEEDRSPFISTGCWEKQSHHFCCVSLIEARLVLCAELTCCILWTVWSVSLQVRWDCGTEMWKPSSSEFVQVQDCLWIEGFTSNQVPCKIRCTTEPQCCFTAIKCYETHISWPSVGSSALCYALGVFYLTPCSVHLPSLSFVPHGFLGQHMTTQMTLDTCMWIYAYPHCDCSGSCSKGRIQFEI